MVTKSDSDWRFHAEKLQFLRHCSSKLIFFASAIDLAPHNILVNAVSPGVVMTDMSKRMLGPKGMKEWARRVPLGRLGNPEEISKVVQFLASKENTYITGQNIVVDGGFVSV